MLDQTISAFFLFIEDVKNEKGTGPKAQGLAYCVFRLEPCSMSFASLIQRIRFFANSSVMVYLNLEEKDD